MKNILVQANKITTCTFTGRKNSLIQGGTAAFNYQVKGPSVFDRSVRTVNGAGVEHKTVNPSGFKLKEGQPYAITEYIQRDWEFTYAACYIAGTGNTGTQTTNGIQNAYVLYGQTTLCTIGNERKFCPVCPEEPACLDQGVDGRPYLEQLNDEKEPLRQGEKSTYPNIISSDNNPIPILISLSSISKTVKSAGFDLIISGVDFTADSTAYFNDLPKQTKFLSFNQLSMKITSGDLLKTGTYSITVDNPLPGGGLSDEKLFNVYSEGCLPCPPPPICNEPLTKPQETLENSSIEKEPLRQGEKSTYP